MGKKLHVTYCCLIFRLIFFVFFAVFSSVQRFAMLFLGGITCIGSCFADGIQQSPACLVIGTR